MQKTLTGSSNTWFPLISGKDKTGSTKNLWNYNSQKCFFTRATALFLPRKGRTIKRDNINILNILY